MKRYAANPVVSLREEFEGALLYNPDTDDIVLLNETGQLIWDAIATPQTLEAISAYLAANTDFAAVLPNPYGRRTCRVRRLPICPTGPHQRGCNSVHRIAALRFHGGI